jgi:tetrapyrrole methylase family protein/MazG family protein
MPSNFEQFCQTIAHLHGPEGCPWDREQTAKSLIRYLLEETYEVIEAINSNDYEKLKGELGDLLLQIVLQAQLASKDKQFVIDDVVKSINDKMIARHPHVFSQQKLQTSKEVLVQWEQLKEAEQTNSTNAGNGKSSALTGVPEALPALLKSLKISEKAVNQGFEWEKEEDIWAQLDSELEEFRQAILAKKRNKASTEVSAKAGRSVADEDLYLEMGDILFTMVNIARWHKVDPEEALLLAIDKFKRRFQLMENQSNRPLKELSTAELNELWQQAKTKLQGMIKNH